MKLDVDDIFGWVGEGDSKMAEVFGEFALSKWLVNAGGAGHENCAHLWSFDSALGVRNAFARSDELHWNNLRDYA